MQRVAFVPAVLVAFFVAASAGAKAPIPGKVPLVVSVAPDGERPARDAVWIDAQIAEAERLFGPLGIHFKKSSTKALGEGFSRLETRKDRDALAAELDPRAVNVMIVSSLRDVDDPRLLRMGVHWRATKTPKKRYVILAASAMPSTLAHELGHYFGLGHSDVANNLMSYSRDGRAVFLDAKQTKTILAFAGIAIAAKDFVPASE